MDKMTAPVRPTAAAGGISRPVNGSIRLPNGDSFRYVRSDIMRDIIASVTRRDQKKAG